MTKAAAAASVAMHAPPKIHGKREDFAEGGKAVDFSSRRWRGAFLAATSDGGGLRRLWLNETKLFGSDGPTGKFADKKVCRSSHTAAEGSTLMRVSSEFSSIRR